MINMRYPKKIFGYNNQFSLQIPVDIPRGLGWSTQSKKQQIRVRLTPFPEQGGFFVQSELHKPVDDFRFLIANLKPKKEDNVNSWERTFASLRVLNFRREISKCVSLHSLEIRSFMIRSLSLNSFASAPCAMSSIQYLLLSRFI